MIFRRPKGVTAYCIKDDSVRGRERSPKWSKNYQSLEGLDPSGGSTLRKRLCPGENHSYHEKGSKLREKVPKP